LASPKTALFFLEFVIYFIHLLIKLLKIIIMPITIARKYKAKDVEMLTATATIIENAIANKTFLQSKRTT
jgi:hypothetical protein